jgi:hypothetical protein
MIDQLPRGDDILTECSKNIRNSSLIGRSVVQYAYSMVRDVYVNIPYCTKCFLGIQC